MSRDYGRVFTGAYCLTALFNYDCPVCVAKCLRAGQADRNGLDQ